MRLGMSGSWKVNGDELKRNCLCVCEGEGEGEREGERGGEGESATYDDECSDNFFGRFDTRADNFCYEVGCHADDGNHTDER